MIETQKVAKATIAREELADRMLSTILNAGIVNPLATLLTAVLEDDSMWWKQFAYAIERAEPHLKAEAARQCFASTLLEAQRRASSK